MVAACRWDPLIRAAFCNALFPGASARAPKMTEGTEGFYAEIRHGSGAFKWHCAGEWRESSSGKTVPVINPCTRSKEYEMQACTQQEVDEAYASAKAAQKAWAKTPLCQRAALLHKVAALMREHAQPMADCLVKEIAKPAKDSLSEVIRWAQRGRRASRVGRVLAVDSGPQPAAAGAARRLTYQCFVLLAGTASI